MLLASLAVERAAAVTTAAAARPGVEAAFKALQVREQEARQVMGRWLAETEARDEHFADKQPNLLSLRMEHRFNSVYGAFAEFRARHPEHAAAAALEAIFRAEVGEDLAAIRQWEEGRLEDPLSPAPWNELAHYLVHSGRLDEAFSCFEKSLALSPREANFFFDFGTALLLYRTEAGRYFRANEAEIFAKVLTLYRRGMKLEPTSFQHAADYAQTFYLLGQARREEGQAAWQHAYGLATSDSQRDEARTHLARYAIGSHRFNLARCYLDPVTDPRLDVVKETLLRRISELTVAHRSNADSAVK